MQVASLSPAPQHLDLASPPPCRLHVWSCPLLVLLLTLMSALPLQTLSSPLIHARMVAVSPCNDLSLSLHQSGSTLLCRASLASPAARVHSVLRSIFVALVMHSFLAVCMSRGVSCPTSISPSELPARARRASVSPADAPPTDPSLPPLRSPQAHRPSRFVASPLPACALFRASAHRACRQVAGRCRAYFLPAHLRMAAMPVILPEFREAAGLVFSEQRETWQRQRLGSSGSAMAWAASGASGSRCRRAFPSVAPAASCGSMAAGRQLGSGCACPGSRRALRAALAPWQQCRLQLRGRGGEGPQRSDARC